eukprot:10869338-Ditylum_brightwellii.AAC.1
MAEQLSYFKNPASRHNNYVEVPDENMGRESMQLYSTGLHKLNSDGTPLRDDDGRPQKIYENYHVVSNSRLFTGFYFPIRRGNVEDL